MKAKLYNIGTVIVTQLLPDGRPGDYITWQKGFRVVRRYSPDFAEARKYLPEEATGKIKEIDVPNYLVQGMESNVAYSEDFTVGLWLGFLFGLGYIDTLFP